MEKILQEKIKELRKEKKLTLEQLAQNVGCTKSYISQLEKGKNVPSVSMLGRLAKALDIQVADLFSEDENNTHWDWYSYLQKQDRRTIHYPDGQVSSQLLTRGIFQKKMQPLISIIEPGGTSNDAVKAARLSHPQGSEEFVLVLKGEIDFWIGSNRRTLCEGDTLYFNGELPHRWANNGKENAEVLFVWTPPIW
jgi:transcriptional regulator with XRE-family HTH domain